MSSLIFFFLQLAIIAYALVGGVFLAFSDFIMRSLAHTGGVGGVDAMQVINREVFRWVFMALFIGLVPLSLMISVYGGIFIGDGPGRVIMLAGLIYFIGCFGVTVCFNVPMNEALAGMDLTADATRDYWTGTYLPRWTFWNTVRTIASSASAALLLFGLLWATQQEERIALTQIKCRHDMFNRPGLFDAAVYVGYDKVLASRVACFEHLIKSKP